MSPFQDTIIDHLNIGVSNADRSRDFYQAALAPLGLKLLHSIAPEEAEDGGEQAKTRGAMYGFGRQYKPLLWIAGNAKVGEAIHFAFIAESRDQADAFYQGDIALDVPTCQLRAKLTEVREHYEKIGSVDAGATIHELMAAAALLRD